MHYKLTGQMSKVNSTLIDVHVTMIHVSVYWTINNSSLSYSFGCITMFMSQCISAILNNFVNIVLKQWSVESFIPSFQNRFLLVRFALLWHSVVGHERLDAHMKIRTKERSNGQTAADFRSRDKCGALSGKYQSSSFPLCYFDYLSHWETITARLDVIWLILVVRNTWPIQRNRPRWAHLLLQALLEYWRAVRGGTRHPSCYES